MSDGSRQQKPGQNPIPYEENMLKTSDGAEIHIWLMTQKDAENCPTLIYFHGNAGQFNLFVL